MFPELTVRDNLLLGTHARNAAIAKSDMQAMLRRFPRLSERLQSRAGLLPLDEPWLGLAPAIIDELFKAIAELRDAGIAKPLTAASRSPGSRTS